MAGDKNVGVSLSVSALVYRQTKRYAAKRFGEMEGAIQSYIRLALTTQIQKDVAEEDEKVELSEA